MITNTGWWNRAAALSLAGVCMAGCRVPVAADQEPSFLSAESVLPLQVPAQNPFIYACPKPTASREATVRRTLPGTTATIALPASQSVNVVPFRDRRGGVMQVGSLGVIAVSYDDQLVVDIQGDFYFTRRVIPPTYNQRCTVPMPRGEAELLASTVLVPLEEDMGTVAQYFTNDMALLTVGPAGRRINLRLMGEPRGVFSTDTSLSVSTLLAAAMSLEW